MHLASAKGKGMLVPGEYALEILKAKKQMSAYRNKQTKRRL